MGLKGLWNDHKLTHGFVLLLLLGSQSPSKPLTNKHLSHKIVLKQESEIVAFLFSVLWFNPSLKCRLENHTRGGLFPKLRRAHALKTIVNQPGKSCRGKVRDRCNILG